MKNYQNIYRAARMLMAQCEPIFSSRERTALELYVSAEALQDYETGRTLPPCDVVQRMVEVYGAHDLKRLHIRACCPLLPDYGGDGFEGLPLAALRWAIEADDMRETALRFARLARDGRITPDELEAALRVRAKAVTLRQVMEESIEAIDQAMKEAAK